MCPSFIPKSGNFEDGQMTTLIWIRYSARIFNHQCIISPSALQDRPFQILLSFIYMAYTIVCRSSMAIHIATLGLQAWMQLLHARVCVLHSCLSDCPYCCKIVQQSTPETLTTVSDYNVRPLLWIMKALHKQWPWNQYINLYFIDWPPWAEASSSNLIST